MSCGGAPRGAVIYYMCKEDINQRKEKAGERQTNSRGEEGEVGAVGVAGVVRVVPNSWDQSIF